MSDSVITLIGVIFTALCGVITQVIISNKAEQKDAMERAVRQQALDDRLDSLEKKVDEHNNYAQKFTSITESIIKMQKDIEYLKEK